MRIVCLLQARTSSSRLPAKVLLPIAGRPLVVLAAQRASNTGLAVQVVTSDEATDDHLCHVLKSYNVPFTRGSLHNTLSRFVKALANYNDEDVVVRLTGDNIFPDGDFIREVVDVFLEQKHTYLATTGEQSGLPHGMSVEVCRVKDIRTSLIKDTDSYTQEHVTPGIIKKNGYQVFENYAELMTGHLSCTVDTLADYLKVAPLFDDENEPELTRWQMLVKKLAIREEAQQLKRLAIGGAQFGLDYGVTNFKGKTPRAEVARMLTLAQEHGIVTIDTANAYGDSEQVISDTIKSNKLHHAFDIISKAPPFTDEINAMPEKDKLDWLVCHIDKSAALFTEQSRLSMLLHRVDQIHQTQGAIWRHLITLKSNRKVANIGVSVQSPDELNLAVSLEKIDIVQMPFNLLDDRWTEAINKLQQGTKSPVKVHIRSVFLQGLLLSEDLSLWQKTGLNQVEIEEVFSWKQLLSRKFPDRTLAQLCIQYVASQTWVEKLVLGMCTCEQLMSNIDLIKHKPLSAKELQFIEQTRPVINTKALNPANWRTE